MSKSSASTQPDNDGPPSRATRRTAAMAHSAPPPDSSPPPADDVQHRMRSLENQVLELKELILALSAAQQLRTPSEPPADTSPIPSIEVESPRRPRLSESVRLPPLQEHRTPTLPRASRDSTEDYHSRHKKSTISEKITHLSDGKEHTFV